MTENKSDDQKKPSIFESALSEQGVPPWLVYALGAVGLIYVLNPTAGILELLPDNLPIIGNLDEAAAAMLVWAGAVEFYESRKKARLWKEAEGGQVIEKEEETKE